MIKIFLIIVLVALIIYIAKGVAKQYSDKLEFYKNLKNFFDIYKLNIGFKKDKLKEIVLNFSSKGDAQILFKNYLEFLENSKDLTCETTLINEQEKTEIIDILKALGQGDYSTEKEKLKITEEYMTKQIEKAQSNKDKICPLIVKLSILFAILVAILFI